MTASDETALMVMDACRAVPLCRRCRHPVPVVLTLGWNSHLCHDLLRSRAFHAFLDAWKSEEWERLATPTRSPIRSLYLMFLKMSPRERDVAVAILRHAGVMPGEVAA